MRKTWTDHEKDTLRAMYPDVRTDLLASSLGRTVEQVYHQAHKLGLKKSATYLASPDACRLRRGRNIGKRNRFPRGHTPWNKGLRGVNFGGKKTQFKPGTIPPNHVPVGTVVMSGDGYLRIKIAEPRTWRYVHRKNWEEAHGPIPAGKCLIFRDGNHENCAIDNLQLLSRKQLMSRNTIHNYPEEIKSVMQIRAGLVRRINDKRRKP